MKAIDSDLKENAVAAMMDAVNVDPDAKYIDFGIAVAKAIWALGEVSPDHWDAVMRVIRVMYRWLEDSKDFSEPIMDRKVT